MKRRLPGLCRSGKESPPRTGAWIETADEFKIVPVAKVAPSHGGVD